MGPRSREGTVKDLAMDDGQGVPGIRRDKGNLRGEGREDIFRREPQSHPASLLLGKSGRKLW